MNFFIGFFILRTWLHAGVRPEIGVDVRCCRA